MNATHIRPPTGYASHHRRRSRRQSPPLIPWSVDRTHLTWPPLRPISCLPSSSAPTLVDPTLGLIPLPSGPHPGSLASSISLRLDRTSATPSSAPRKSHRFPRLVGLRGPERTRKAPALGATRLDARMDTVSDLDRPSGPRNSFRLCHVALSTTFAPPPDDHIQVRCGHGFGLQPSHSGLPVTLTCLLSLPPFAWAAARPHTLHVRAAEWIPIISRTPKPRLPLAFLPQLCSVTCCPSTAKRTRTGPRHKASRTASRCTPPLLEGQVEEQW